MLAAGPPAPRLPEVGCLKKACFHAQLPFPAESLLCTTNVGQAATCSFPSVQSYISGGVITRVSLGMKTFFTDILVLTAF